MLLAWVAASENLFSTFLHTWVQQEGRLPQMLPQVLRMGVFNMFSRPEYKNHPSVNFPSNGWKPKWCWRQGCYMGVETATHDTWLVWEGKCEDDTAIATLANSSTSFLWRMFLFLSFKHPLQEMLYPMFPVHLDT